MSENNESGNRWEAAPKPSAGAIAPVASEPAIPPVDEEADGFRSAGPADPGDTSQPPRWVNKRALVAAGTAAAFFLGGGGVGYAVAHGHNHDGQPLQSRFDRSGFGPGQVPGDGEDDFQAPPGQSQSDDAAGSSFGTQS